ncbi:MAG: 30S ribosomal protein S9 [Elusimicrobia bacterium]|nr:30S ribosomal protein S9 [Elusimicrobiota bacterium]
MAQGSIIQATGRRKNASARVKILEGTGKIIVNNKSIDDFFSGLERHKKEALRPVLLFPSANSHDIYVNVRGGGITGQAGAISLGIARAFLKMDPSLKQNLRKENLLTRDSRMVERKKPGRPKARKRFQYGKR